MTETEDIRQRYKRRLGGDCDSLYSPLLPEVLLGKQEKERALIRWINHRGLEPVKGKRILEEGFGAGENILHFMELGFLPENLVGNELLEERAMNARKKLPEAIKILVGDATEIDLAEGPFDIVYQSTVFTSILDKKFQQNLADRMWALTKPGGGVLWYDFIYNNPRNPDVRGVPLKRIRVLFPAGKIHRWKLTLAPPISRRVTRIHPNLYHLFNLFPFLRTHLLCWIQKPI